MGRGHPVSGTTPHTYRRGVCLSERVTSSVPVYCPMTAMSPCPLLCGLIFSLYNIAASLFHFCLSFGACHKDRGWADYSCCCFLFISPVSGGSQDGFCAGQKGTLAAVWNRNGGRDEAGSLVRRLSLQWQISMEQGLQ